MTWQPFPLGHLPDPVRDYVVQAADAVGCDPSYVALPLLTCLGAAIGNTRVVQVKRTWTEPPLLWTLIVGESGTQKSPACELATAFVRARQDRLFAAHRQALEAAEHGKDTSPPPLSTAHCPLPTVVPRLLVSDITLEALVVRLVKAERGLLLVRDEAAGWLRSFDQYRAGRGGDLAHYLSLHRAGSLTLDRKKGNHQTLHIPRAFVAITGSVQAELWPKLMTPDCYAAGLTARLLLAMPPRPRRRWSEQDVTTPALTRLQKVFDCLYDLEGTSGPVGMAPLPVRFSDDAKALWLRFFEAHAGQLAERCGDLAAAWSKLEAYCPRLALIVHLVRWADHANGAGPDLIDEMSMNHAIHLTTWFARETERIYRLFRLPLKQDDEEDAKLLMWVRRHGGATSARDVLHHFRNRFISVDDADQTLLRLAGNGFFTTELSLPGPRGGRPAVIYRLK